MLPIRKILVPTDYSTCAKAALRHAGKVAAFYNAEVLLFHVDDNGSNDVQPASAEGLVKHVTVRRCKNVAECIVRYAAEQEVDLIVMGAHGDNAASRFLLSGLDHFLVGNTTEQVLLKARTPVLTIGLRRSAHPDQVRRILVPVDPTEPTTDSLSFARELGAVYDAQLDLLCVCNPDGDSARDLRSDLIRERLQQRFEAAKGPEVQASCFVVYGKPARDIPAFAEKHGDQLIVLGLRQSSSNREASADELGQMASFSVLSMHA